MFINHSMSVILITITINLQATPLHGYKCNDILSNVSPFLDTNFKVSELLENCSPRGTSPPLCDSSPSASPRRRWVRTTRSSWVASDVASCSSWMNWRCCSRSAAMCADVSGSLTLFVRLPICSPTYCWATIRAPDDQERRESRGDVCDDRYNLLESDGHDTDDTVLVVDTQPDNRSYTKYRKLHNELSYHRNCVTLHAT